MNGEAWAGKVIDRRRMLLGMMTAAATPLAVHAQAGGQEHPNQHHDPTLPLKIEDLELT